MSVGTLLHKIGNAIGHLFTANNLTAAEKFVADNLGTFGKDLAAFSDALPNEFASLKALAEQAQKLYQEAKGKPLSLSLAVHLAQAAITAHWPEIVAEAEKLIAEA